MTKRKEVKILSEIYNPKARLSAFIFIDNHLFLANTHTECIINFLIEKKLVKSEKQFFKMLNNPKDKYQNKIKQWSNAIEKYSIFGELSFYEKQLSLFVFDNISEYGLNCLKPIVYSKYGNIPIYYAKYDINVENHFDLIKL